MTRFLRRWKRIGGSEAPTESDSETQGKAALPAEKGDVSQVPVDAFSLQKGRLGLVLVHDAAVSTVEETDAFAVDIIFVHGLNGDARGTWTHKNGRCWPRDLLPFQMPGARIFSYGYDSRIFFSTSDAEYRDFALGLVRELQYLGHSFALNVASERDTSQEVLTRCKGIVFLGTPHRGSGIAGPGALVANVLKVVWKPGNFVIPGPRDKLVSDLERSSKALFAIADRFVGKARGMGIASFYETNKTPPTGQIIVDENSGVLGLDHERRWPMFLNHHEISRFPDGDSSDFKAVVAALREMASAIYPSRKSAKSDHSLTHSERECVHQLHAVDVVEFEAQIETRLPDTLLWLPKDSHYTSWLSKASTALLLVTGFAGCGKTVMSSYLSAEFREASFPTSIICRFYCDAKVPEMSTAVGLMRSVIHQTILRSREALRMAIKAARHDQRLWESFERLWSLFEHITTSAGAKQIVVIIDAIDELDEIAQRKLSSHILHFMRSEVTATTKFLITSQPHAPAVAELRPHCIRLALESKQDVLADDINTFIGSKLRKLQAEMAWSDRIRRRLTDALEDKADGSFLWASFALAFLKQRDILDMNDLEDALSQVPPNLTKFYNRYLRTIVTRDVPGPALRLLNMVLSSVRPLEVSELAVLLAIDKSHTSIADVQGDFAISGVHSVQHVLGPLIKSYKSKIQLIHTSLKDHLAEQGAEFGVSELKGHELLAEKCIRYLLLRGSHRDSLETLPSVDYCDSQTTSSAVRDDVLEDSESETQGSILRAAFGEFDSFENAPSGPGSELFDYAARFWASHFYQCDQSENTDLFALAMELYDSFSTNHFYDFRRKGVETFGEFPSEPEPLSLACFYGHDIVTRHILALGNSSAKLVRTAFYWAAVRGHLGCLQLLSGKLDSGDDTRSVSRSPLPVAAVNGHVDVIEFLIEGGLCDVNESDSKGRSALSQAAGRSQERVVSFLLGSSYSAHLDVNSQDLKGRTPLLWACSANSRGIVKQLLRDPRTNVELADHESCDALGWACRDGLTEISRLLVDAGVRRGCPDKSGRTPLIHAVRSGDLKTIKILFAGHRHERVITSNADIFDLNFPAVDKDGRNAISWAAEASDSHVLELLLSASPDEALVADHNGWLPLAWAMNPPGFPCNGSLLLAHSHEKINQRSYNGNSLLSIAICWDSFQIAQALLRHSDLNIDARNDEGRTALSLAASRGAIDIVKMLVEQRKADWLCRDHVGKSALDWAISAGHTEVVEYLESIRRGTNDTEVVR